jgi:hypothetical protein
MTAPKVKKSTKANTLTLKLEEGKSKERRMAEAGQSAVITNAITALTYAKGTFGELDLGASADVMREKVAAVNTGDLSGVEATLVAQAAALNAIFTELARRGALNMGEYLSASETYLRLALKAQSQCRATLETLANIKNPPVAYVRQANIAHGPQQVNNGIKSDARESATSSNELSPGRRNELPPDSGTSSVTSRVDTQVEAVGEVHRAEDG